MKYRVVETDNFGGDYPDEKFLHTPPLTEKAALAIADLINEAAGQNASRYWRVVKVGYKLVPGFEP